jgi:hypothetical protein
MNHRLSHLSHHEATMLTPLETPSANKINGTLNLNGLPSSRASKARKQRVTITLPLSLLERLRNAVYWTGHGPLARLISDALDDAVTHMERTNGQAFPQRLAPLKRGRPRKNSHPAAVPLPRALTAPTQ